MNWEPLALIITALGGFELIRYLAEWRSRRRQSEFHILEETIQFLQQEIKESVQREAEMTDRIYSLNSKLLEAEKKISGLMLELQRKRCDKLACRHRQPPNEYTRQTTQTTISSRRTRRRTGRRSRLSRTA